MSWLRDIFGKSIRVLGVPLPDRKNLHFKGSVTGVDNPSGDSTDITVVVDGTSTFVTSVFGRDGDVVAQSGDYQADLITYNPAISGLVSTDAQGAIDEVYTNLTGQLESACTSLSISNISPPQHSLSSADIGSMLTVPSASNVNIISPDASQNDIIPIGSIVYFTTLLPGGSITFQDEGSASFWVSRDDTNKKLTLANGRVAAIKVNATDWALTGDLEGGTPLDIVPACTLDITAGQSITTGSDLDFSILREQGGFSQSNSSTLLLPRAGVYQFDVQVRCTCSSTDAVRTVWLDHRYNGSGSSNFPRDGGTRFTSNAASGFQIYGSSSYELGTGATVSFRAGNFGAGGSVDPTQVFSRISVTYLGGRD